MKKKTVKNMVIFMSMILIGGIIFVITLCNDSKVDAFDLSDFQYEIQEYKSDKILGTTENRSEAKKKAVQIWCEIYGNDIKKKKTYKVFFDEAEDVWLIKGSMLSKNMVGGVPYILIQKSDGKVLAIWHDK